NKAGKNSGADKGDHDLRMFNYADMEFHGRPQQSPGDKRNKNIADAADEYCPRKTDGHRFPHLFLIPPKNRGGGGGAHQHMNRVKDMEQSGGSFRKPPLIKKKSDVT